MAQTWPVSLQQKLNEQGFTFSLGETVTTSSMGVGPAKKRRRFTKPIDTLRGTINLEESDYQTFYDFFNTTLNGGIEVFEYEHPITKLTQEFRFVRAPNISPLGGSYFRVSMEWEILP